MFCHFITPQNKNIYLRISLWSNRLLHSNIQLTLLATNMYIRLSFRHRQLKNNLNIRNFLIVNVQSLFDYNTVSLSVTKNNTQLKNKSPMFLTPRPINGFYKTKQKLSIHTTYV